jgi:hypothetical protein
MSIKQKLKDLHRNFHGAETTGDETELTLIVEILETLIEKVEEQENHSHSIS